MCENHNVITSRKNDIWEPCQILKLAYLYASVTRKKILLHDSSVEDNSNLPTMSTSMLLSAYTSHTQQNIPEDF
jgi:hypothetical protein